MTVIIGDLDAKFKNWYGQDKLSFDCSTIDSRTFQFGLQANS